MVWTKSRSEPIRKGMMALSWGSYGSFPMCTEVLPMAPPTRRPELTDLTDDQGTILQPLIPPAKRGGRPRAVDMRAVINTILALNRTGCQGDMLPHDLLPRRTVDEYCAPWRQDGTWQQMMDRLRADVRRQQAPSQAPPPSAASMDSPSVETTERGGERSSDGGKHSTGHKCHLRVDTAAACGSRHENPRLS